MGVASTPGEAIGNEVDGTIVGAGSCIAWIGMRGVRRDACTGVGEGVAAMAGIIVGAHNIA